MLLKAVFVNCVNEKSEVNDRDNPKLSQNLSPNVAGPTSKFLPKLKLLAEGSELFDGTGWVTVHSLEDLLALIEEIFETPSPFSRFLW